MNRRVTICLLALITLTACPTPSEVYLPDRGIGGTVGEPEFEQWTPAEPADLPLDDALRPSTVFDAWHIEDDAFRESSWDGLFHLLAGVNQTLESPDLEAVMMRLEPEMGEANWEVVFVSHQQADAEGLVLNIVDDQGMTLWVEAVREAGASTQPKRWNIRAEPAVEESDGLVLRFEADGAGGWEGFVGDGADGEADEPLETELQWQDLLENLRRTLWEPVTDREYVQPEIEVRQIEGEVLGRTVEERELEDFVVDSVFPPPAMDL